VAGTGVGSAAYVFVRSDTIWTEQQKLTTDINTGDELFYSILVAVSGDTAVLGAFEENADSGAGYVFARNDTNWNLQYKLTTSDGIGDAANFGYPVAISNDTVILGAPMDDYDVTSTGSAYVFLGSGPFQVVRGGGFNDGASSLRATNRDYVAPSSQESNLGFRCARYGEKDGGQSECNPTGPCCKADGTACEHGCDGTDCYANCNPSDNCCESDGTTCEHGCDGTNCWPECDPNEPTNNCCDSDGYVFGDEVQQPSTAIYWRKCPLGQTLQGSCACTGNTTMMEWCIAMGMEGAAPCEVQAGPNICESTLGTDYRLPSGQEYLDLLGDCDTVVLPDGNEGYCASCTDSATCTDMFDSDENDYWSSTPEGDTGHVAWHIHFDTGYIEISGKPNAKAIRCVREEL
jgi:hypothetical protein